VPELTGLLGSSLEGAASFPYRLEELWTFPGRGTPRVIWVGPGAGAREFAALASRLERRLAPASFVTVSELPFRAHVTLGRPTGPRGLGRLLDLLGEVSVPGAEHSLREVRLVESRLDSRGAVYLPVARFPLQGSPDPGNRAIG
jgi:2'-5' RNA ligase